MTTRSYHRVLIVGAGLIGTSIVLARRAVGSAEQFDAVEPSPHHREVLQTMIGVFDDIYTSVDAVSKSYDLLILAAPPKVSQSLLKWALSVSEIVTDVCSVKQGMCDEANTLSLSEQSRYISGHPMAGKATSGPEQASATLFNSRPWLFIVNEFKGEVPTSPRVEVLKSWVREIGAVPKVIENADDHDRIMSYVSHGVHVTSLATMHTVNDIAANRTDISSNIAGPAFWDITRLAASPPDFWVDTLLINRVAVGDYLGTLIGALEQVRSLLQSSDATKLYTWLDQAQQARRQWETKREDLD